MNDTNMIDYLLSLSHEDFFKIAEDVIYRKMSVNMAIEEHNKEEKTDEPK